MDSDLNPNARPFDFSGSPPESSPDAFAFADAEAGWASDFAGQGGPYARSVPLMTPAYVARRPSKKVCPWAVMVVLQALPTDTQAG